LSNCLIVLRNKGTLQAFYNKTNIMPMGLTSTPFLSLSDIETDEIDLVGDAFGLSSTFGELTDLLDKIGSEVPDDSITERLLDKIRKTK